jgi:hypothetical protein
MALVAHENFERHQLDIYVGTRMRYMRNAKSNTAIYRAVVNGKFILDQKSLKENGSPFR